MNLIFRRPKIIEAVYVAACMTLAAFVVFSSGENYLPFYVLFLATVPASIFAYSALYVGGGLLFGLSESFTASVYAFTVWALTSIVQVILLRIIFEAWAERRSTSG